MKYIFGHCKGVAYVEATEAAASVKNICKQKILRQLNFISMFSIKGQLIS